MFGLGGWNWELSVRTVCSCSPRSWGEPVPGSHWSLECVSVGGFIILGDNGSHSEEDPVLMRTASECATLLGAGNVSPPAPPVSRGQFS